MIKLRDANGEDCEALYIWRNHPSARQFSLGIEEISRENHDKWFEESLRNSERKIYIAEDKGKKVGQVRFDREGENIARVSVTVNPDFYGKGHGTTIIREGSKKYFAEVHVDIIRAEIKPENIASVKAFEKAGYKKSEEKDGLLEYRVKNGEI